MSLLNLIIFYSIPRKKTRWLSSSSPPCYIILHLSTLGKIFLCMCVYVSIAVESIQKIAAHKHHILHVISTVFLILLLSFDFVRYSQYLNHSSLIHFTTSSFFSFCFSLGLLSLNTMPKKIKTVIISLQSCKGTLSIGSLLSALSQSHNHIAESLPRYFWNLVEPQITRTLLDEHAWSSAGGPSLLHFTALLSWLLVHGLMVLTLQCARSHGSCWSYTLALYNFPLGSFSSLSIINEPFFLCRLVPTWICCLKNGFRENMQAQWIWYRDSKHYALVLATIQRQAVIVYKNKPVFGSLTITIECHKVATLHKYVKTSEHKIIATCLYVYQMCHITSLI
ncbi:hypothetical protein VP01_14g1 [Puccinia sorghi]|uniref:Uncharacterized protein n=1 Tax=Puccinia sorghi TaxID=27349 RepID=A0A0L6VJ32_9BASI|nr:hypothetical protein VP01_14g1 [Puccinia sorghi]